MALTNSTNLTLANGCCITLKELKDYIAIASVAGAKFYSNNIALTANTPFVVNHNLALISPTNYMFTARDNADGSSVEVTITAETVNSLTIVSNVTMPSVRVAVTGL